MIGMAALTTLAAFTVADLVDVLEAIVLPTVLDRPAEQLNELIVMSVDLNLVSLQVFKLVIMPLHHEVLDPAKRG